MLFVQEWLLWWTVRRNFQIVLPLWTENWWFIYFTGIWKWYFGSRERLVVKRTENLKRVKDIHWPYRTLTITVQWGMLYICDAVNQLRQENGEAEFTNPKCSSRDLETAGYISCSQAQPSNISHKPAQHLGDSGGCHEKLSQLSFSG